jgi:outer membrane protein, multidrug efflux system
VLLVGQPLPAHLPAPQALDAEQVVADLGAGVPSEVLLRRPDVAAAEHVLRAANADIGAARAAFFPSISLTGFAGLASTALANLLTGGAFAWSFTPAISVPLFTGGRNTANLDLAKVRKHIEVARYERTIQNAFREVADGLVARGYFDGQLEAQTERVAALQKAFEISNQRYTTGIENYLVVLIAQRELYEAQNQLVEVRLQRLQNLADLYRALGGGWRER